MSMKTIRSSGSQSGAVSLFVVIFATLLITVVTVSFLRLMVNNQNQASNNDLSQSAYDSAQAGVEDAKRALLRYKEICAQSKITGDGNCDALANEIEAADCNEALRIGGVVSTPTDGNKKAEVFVKQSEGVDDTILGQAYTCVKIVLRTDDYVGSLAPNESKLIPLVGVDTAKNGTPTYDTVKVEWYSLEDLGATENDNDGAVDMTGPLATQPLLSQNEWPANRPSVLRTQLMQFGANFRLSQFDTTENGTSNGNAVFLYPTKDPAAIDGTTPVILTDRDTRRTTTSNDPLPSGATDTPLPIECKSNIAGGGYACTSTITIPAPIGNDPGKRTAYLRLTPFYNASHFRVTLWKNGSLVKFDSVQPEVDSTGRANDLFRRVSSRVDLIDTSFPYPDAAVDVSGNLCKNFSITDKEADFNDNGCQP